VCVDLNSTVLSTMDPYLVDAAPSLDQSWLVNPDPDLYTSWAEFAKQLFWDYQAVGEAFVLSTAEYTTGWPARFHVVPPWLVNVWLDRGRRAYEIAGDDVTGRLLHIRYQASVWDLHGHGPLEAIAGKVAASGILARYASQMGTQGGIPSSVLEHPEQLTPTQAAELRNQWVQARIDALGAPAVLSGGVTWKPTQMNAEEMALMPLSDRVNSDIAVALRVPPFLVGLPGSGDSATYKNVTNLLDYHWRAGLRPLAEQLTRALSGWLLPRGTSVEVNSDAYVQPEPYVRAQTAQIYNAIRDEQGNPALTVQEIREAERLTDSVLGPTPQAGGPIQ
jgi:HK97 family phage portal protein